MTIEQIYTGCLAQGAYYIESNGEAAIIDPLREVTPYLKRAAKDNAKIMYVFETHFHADFVSGHVTLAEKTGAPIIYGPNANPTFEALIATDGQEFKLGKTTIKVLHTPGHTLESTTYLLKDENGKDHAIFSGDTLFLGDVGRPDLAQKGAMTQDDLAGLLYDSLRSKIMPLADDVTVYPAHGAGSACGKNMMKETVDLLGNQKKVNYALRADMTKAEFIKEVTDGLAPPPEYFPLNVKMNREGYEDISEVLKRGHTALDAEDFETAANTTGAVVLDVRHQNDFINGHIPRSIFIGLHGDFAPWVGALIADTEQPLLLIVPEGKEEETLTRLSRVGFDGTIGYLKGGIEAWRHAGKDLDTLASQPAAEAAEKIRNTEQPVFDVRKKEEYRAERLTEAVNTPLGKLNSYLSSFPKGESFFIHCAGGYRSVIAASILKSRGIHNMVNIEGGFNTLKTDGLETVGQACSGS
ncbi:MBL fold metallo-hydrolase [Maribacter sp. 2-571]|uniref:MBL fold metallo-hydrolase n=1 Tax=Maribacter sp. 2-571 TaxID=3417569 RepID=UPI003D329CBA